MYSDMSQDAEVRQLREAFRQARDEAYLVITFWTGETDNVRIRKIIQGFT